MIICVEFIAFSLSITASFLLPIRWAMQINLINDFSAQHRYAI